MKRWSLSILLLSFSFLGIAKEVEIDTFLVRMESEINNQLQKVRSTKDDNLRLLENETLKALVEEILPYPGTFEYPFESFKTMSTITSPDGVFRLFNWNIEDNSGMNIHFCYLIMPSRAGKPNEIIEFKEDNFTLPPRPENTLVPTTWYGAIYYKILPVTKGNKTYYTVLGYDGSTRGTNKKIIDVFFFKNDNLRMGYPMFQEAKNSKTLVRRVFFEYSEKVTIGVNMNEQLDAIVFDHLIPEMPNLEGMYDFYVPDMTYDGYRWDGNNWIYLEDLVAGNNESRRTKLYGPGDQEDTVKFVEVKDDWIDPVDGNPNGGGTSAVAPIDLVEDGKNGKKKPTKDRVKTKTHRGKAKKPRSAIRND
jgi:hypothetical protein